MFIPYNYNITTTHKPLHCMVIAKKGKSGKELKDEAKKTRSENQAGDEGKKGEEKC